MRKSAEPCFAVMGSHATGPNTSESKTWDASLEDDIVETDCSGTCGAQEALLLIRITTKQIDGERLVLTLDAGDGIVEIIDFNHRE